MTQYGICHLSLVPLRAEPLHKSELTSQLLFGESFEILDRKNEWLLIKLAHDGYEGWVDSNQITEIPSDIYNSIISRIQQITDLSTHAILMKLGHDEMLHLLPGSTLPVAGSNEEAEGLYSIADTEYMFLGLSRDPDTINFVEEVEEVTRFYHNAPYLWGGRSLYGIDCSGFTQMVYKHFGVSIPRDAYQQAEKGDTIDFLQNAIPGDLAFFDSSDGKITHVGILLNENEIVHASGYVKVDKIDENGIFSIKDQKYTHKLRIIKRLV